MTSRVSRRSSLLTGVLIVPASLFYLLLLVAPIVIIVVFSFGFSGTTGGYAGGFTAANYADLLANNIDPFITRRIPACRCCRERSNRAIS